MQELLKPPPKDCTKPEPFHLESRRLHEQEQERLRQKKLQAEQLESALREFRAQPHLLKYGLILTVRECLSVPLISHASTMFSL